jgi:hypothetical protein
MNAGKSGFKCTPLVGRFTTSSSLGYSLGVAQGIPLPGAIVKFDEYSALSNNSCPLGE